MVYVHDPLGLDVGNNILYYEVYLIDKSSETYELHKEQIEEQEKLCFEDMPKEEWLDWRPFFYADTLDGINMEHVHHIDNVDDD